MSCFTDMPGLATGTPDPTKHVNYALGMVLGEDDFKQEFSYLAGRDQWLARDLIGYGTVRGLKVHTEWDGSKGPRIYVDPGVALTPAGQLVCVPSPQCANVNAWLAKHADEVQTAVASPPTNPLSLYVVLCYRECPDDNVPIPGEPCRTEDQLVKPSRLRDDFALEVTLKRPVQREERALRDFCEWLRLIDMTDSTVTSVKLDRFLDEIRRAAAPWYSPPSASPPDDFMFGSPPTTLRVNPGDAPRYLRAAFHLWVTELRPKWFARWYGCAPDAKEPAPLEDCVLLGEVQVGLLFDAGTSAFKAVDSNLPPVVEDDRPYILHLRMLQEWLIGGASALPIGSGAVGPVPGSPITPETTFGLSPNDGRSPNYARADHAHGTPELPAPGGDIGGTIMNAIVGRLRGIEVVNTAGAAGNVLMLSTVPTVPPTLRWEPRPLQFVQRGATQLYTVVAAGQFEFALTPDAAGNSPPAGTVANPVSPSAFYNGLRAVVGYDATAGGFRFTFTNFAVGLTYIVKLTPWVKGGTSAPFWAHFSEFVGPSVPPAPALAAGFYVTIAVNRAVAIPATGRLMIEVSQIG